MRAKRRAERERIAAERQRARREQRHLREARYHAQRPGEITITGGRGVRMWTARLGVPTPTGDEPFGPGWVPVEGEIIDLTLSGREMPGRRLDTSISFDILNVIDDRGPRKHDPWQDN